MKGGRVRSKLTSYRAGNFVTYFPGARGKESVYDCCLWCCYQFEITKVPCQGEDFFFSVEYSACG